MIQDTYWIARAGIILLLSRNEITFIACNPNGRTPQDRADHSIQLYLIPDLVIDFVAYEAMATTYVSNARVRTIC